MQELRLYRAGFIKSQKNPAFLLPSIFQRRAERPNGEEFLREQEEKIMRVETDLIGTKEIDQDAYYGLQTLRAYENFNITGRRAHPEFIRSLAAVKKAAAITNCQIGELSEERRDAIVQACD